jgi:SAM-dependent methyltransferase
VYNQGTNRVVDLSEIAPKLQLAPEGFWISPNVSKVSYEEEHNDICFAVEDQSFWFTYRNECILNAVRLFPPPGAVFDVGGGNGYIAKALQDAGLEVVLVEPGLRGVRNARQRGVSHVVRSTLGDAGFRTGVIPAVGLFDVVEHIEDDRGFLTDLHTYLIPGGRVYLTVPAFRRLWSHEDIVAGHQRRYTVSQICAVLRDSGFEIDYATYFFNFLLLPIYFLRALPYALGIKPRKDMAERVHRDHHISNGAAQRVIRWLSGRELKRMASRCRIRVGASCLVVARKSLSDHVGSPVQNV